MNSSRRDKILYNIKNVKLWNTFRYIFLEMWDRTIVRDGYQPSRFIWGYLPIPHIE